MTGHKLLSADDVRNMVFTTVRLREGYDLAEVDVFLGQVEATLARLHRENERHRAASPEQAAELVAAARAEADVIIAEARARAEAIEREVHERLRAVATSLATVTTDLQLLPGGGTG
ncbi:DivIVA domain-containing protein [Acrocarpospora catenulata]|uniref:DivIVA domain-containing protein n=1 Tax=Acrocarpospora catenulata TaxID=2836182 RepID=UPI001BDAF22F|nr:DivIVA domain-containing protein [Acrocarpospora catenulata]